MTEYVFWIRFWIRMDLFIYISLHIQRFRRVVQSPERKTARRSHRSAFLGVFKDSLITEIARADCAICSALRERAIRRASREIAFLLEMYRIYSAEVIAGRQIFQITED